MATKLTLNIDEEVVKKAKSFSRREGKSLSKIVEEYLRTISDRKKENVFEKIRSITKGKITHPEVDWKEVKTAHLNKKYNV